MTEPPNAHPTTTEDVPSAPGWVEQALDEILADPDLGLDLGQHPGLRDCRNAYLDCLASAGRQVDIDDEHDRCRRGLLRAIAQQHDLPATHTRRLEQRLETLEGELSARI